MKENVNFCLNHLRKVDREIYTACLYLPKEVREAVVTLWAFDAEISRIPSLVSEPDLGEIRYQWWHDRLKLSEFDGSGPLLEALGKVIKEHDLPTEGFSNYLDARIQDLYHDPIPDNGTLEGYLGETVSVFFQMAALCLGGERNTNLANACGHAGMAVGLARLMSQFARHRKQGRVYVPLDLLFKHGLAREDWLAADFTDRHHAAVDEWVRTIQYHLTFARKVIEQLPKNLHPVFLPLAMVPPKLAFAKRKPGQIFQQGLEVSPLACQWHNFLGAIRQIP